MEKHAKGVSRGDGQKLPFQIQLDSADASRSTSVSEDAGSVEVDRLARATTPPPPHVAGIPTASPDSNERPGDGAPQAVPATDESDARTPVTPQPRWRQILQRSVHASKSKVALALDLTSVAFVVHVARVFIKRLTLPFPSLDEQYFIWCGWSLLKGQVPYRDFNAFKPPMSYFTNALAIAIFGLEENRFRYLLSGLAVASIALLVFSLVRRGADRVLAVALGCLTAAFLCRLDYHDSSINDVESLGLTYYLFGLAAFLYPTRRVVVSQLLGAMFMSFTVLTKEPYALTVFPTWLIFLVLAMRDQPDPRRAAVGYLKVTLGTVTVILVSLFLYLVIAGGLKPYIATAKFYIPFAAQYCVINGRFKLNGFEGEKEQIWHYLHERFLNFDVLGIWIPFVAAQWTIFRRHFLLAVLGALTILGGIWSVTIGHCFWRHYMILAIGGFVLSGALGIDAMRGALNGQIRRWVRLTAMVGVWAALWPRYDAESSASYFPVPMPISPQLVATVQQHSGPDDYVLTTGSPILYVMADRRSADPVSTYVDALIDLYPGANDQEKLAFLRAKLIERQPRVIYVDETKGDNARHHRALIRPFLAEFNYKDLGGNVYVLP